MNDITIGESITNSVGLIEKVGREIDSLLTLTEEEVNRELSDRSFGLFPYVGTWQYSSNPSESEWVYKDVAISLELGERSNSRIKRYLSIQISLTGEGVESAALNNKEPLVHVCFWEMPIDFTEDIYFNLTEVDAHLEDEVLWNWKPEANRWNEHEWTYSLQLTSINTLEDIRHKIVAPFIALLLNKKEALQELQSLQGILLHNKIEF